MSKCYIIGAGEMHGSFITQSTDLVIAADGGYDYLISNGMSPDILIGDFDSVTSDIPNNIEVIRHPIEKDETDSFLAYKEGVKRGYSEFEIYGGTGGREDHTYANLAMLLYAKRHSHRAVLYGRNTVSFVLIGERVKLSAKAGTNLSVFSISESSTVSIKCAKYEVESKILYNDFPLGVSNSFAEAPAVLEVHSGEILVVANESCTIEYIC